MKTPLVINANGKIVKRAKIAIMVNNQRVSEVFNFGSVQYEVLEEKDLTIKFV